MFICGLFYKKLIICNLYPPISHPSLIVIVVSRGGYKFRRDNSKLFPGPSPLPAFQGLMFEVKKIMMTHITCVCRGGGVKQNKIFTLYDEICWFDVITGRN